MQNISFVIAGVTKNKKLATGKNLKRQNSIATEKFTSKKPKTTVRSRLKIEMSQDPTGPSKMRTKQTKRKVEIGIVIYC